MIVWSNNVVELESLLLDQSWIVQKCWRGKWWLASQSWQMLSWAVTEDTENSVTGHHEDMEDFSTIDQEDLVYSWLAAPLCIEFNFYISIYQASKQGVHAIPANCTQHWIISLSENLTDLANAGATQTLSVRQTHNPAKFSSIPTKIRMKYTFWRSERSGKKVVFSWYFVVYFTIFALINN